VGFRRVPRRAYLWNAGQAAWPTCAAGVRRNVSMGGSEGARGRGPGAGCHTSRDRRRPPRAWSGEQGAAVPHANFRHTPLIREAIGSDAGLPASGCGCGCGYRKRTRRRRRRGGGIRCEAHGDRVWGEREVTEAIWRGGATPPQEEERRASSRVKKRGQGDVGTRRDCRWLSSEGAARTRREHRSRTRKTNKWMGPNLA
jgi:hypothetical protein